MATSKESRYGILFQKDGVMFFLKGLSKKVINEEEVQYTPIFTNHIDLAITNDLESVAQLRKAIMDATDVHSEIIDVEEFKKEYSWFVVKMTNADGKFSYFSEETDIRSTNPNVVPVFVKTPFKSQRLRTLEEAEYVIELLEERLPDKTFVIVQQSAFETPIN